MRFTRFLVNRISEQNRWELLNIGSLGVGSAFFASLLFIYNWGLNPVFLRVFTPNSITWGPGNHHALIMVIFGVTFFGTIALRVAPIFALLGLYAMVELYELEWYATYAAAKNIFGGAFEWSWMVVVILAFPAVFWYAKTFGFPWRYVAFLAPMFLGWLLLGFPISEDFPFHTIYYYNFSVNLFEITTHAIASIGFIYTILPKLQQASSHFRGGFVEGFSPMYRFIRELF